MRIKIVYLKVLSTFLGFTPSALVSKSFLLKVLYNLWRIAVVSLNIYSTYLHYTYLRSTLRSKSSLRTKATKYVRTVYSVTPLITYIPLGALRVVLILLDVLNFSSFQNKVNQIACTLRIFTKNYPEIEKGSQKFTKNELLYLFTMLLAYSRNFLRAYAIEMTSRSRTAWSQGAPRPLHKTCETFVRAVLLELTALDALSFFVIVLLSWFRHCIKVMNKKLESLKSIEIKSKININHRDATAQYTIHYYNDLTKVWKCMETVMGLIIFFNFLIWMITLNFSSFFALSLTNDNMGKYSKVLQITAQLNVICILLRFFCVDNAVHNLEYQVSFRVTYNKMVSTENDL